VLTYTVEVISGILISRRLRARNRVHFRSVSGTKMACGLSPVLGRPVHFIVLISTQPSRFRKCVAQRHQMQLMSFKGPLSLFIANTGKRGHSQLSQNDDPIVDDVAFNT
jgi:hypothetical protein